MRRTISQKELIRVTERYFDDEDLFVMDDATIQHILRDVLRLEGNSSTKLTNAASLPVTQNE